VSIIFQNFNSLPNNALELLSDRFKTLLRGKIFVGRTQNVVLKLSVCKRRAGVPLNCLLVGNVSKAGFVASSHPQNKRMQCVRILQMFKICRMFYRKNKPMILKKKYFKLQQNGEVDFPTEI
jgi:hypothetical protein